VTKTINQPIKKIVAQYQVEQWEEEEGKESTLIEKII
jgi:hypothetical protein